MEKANKKGKIISSVESMNMAKRNVAFTSTMEMSMREILLMAFLMEKES